jgi:hypothetical protein
LRSLRLDNSKLTLVITNFEFQKSDVLESLLILNLTSSKSVLKNLDLLVKKSQLIISSDQLGSENISFVDDVLVIFLQLFNLFIRLLDDVSQLLNLVVEFDHCLHGDLLLGIDFLQITFNNINFLHLFSFFIMDLSQSLILSLDFILQLRDLMGCDLELSLKLSNFILCFNQVLRIEISIRPNSLIQVLLLLELSFEFNILFLELTDQVLLQLDLFNHLHQVSIGFGSFMGESISLLFQLVDLFQEVGNVLVLSRARLFPLGDFILLLGELVLVFEVLFLSFLDVLRHHVSVSDEVKNVGLFGISLLSEVLNLSSECTYTRFGDKLLVFSFELLSGDHLLLLSKLGIHSFGVLVVLLNGSKLSSHLSNVNLGLFVLREQLFVISFELVLEVLHQSEVSRLCIKVHLYLVFSGIQFFNSDLSGFIIKKSLSFFIL